MFEIKNIVRLIEEGQYVRVVNTSGNDIILPISLFGEASTVAALVARINTLTSSKNLALAAGVIRPTSTVIGEPITWNFLDPQHGDQDHDKIFFTGTVTASGSEITIVFPSATVITGIAGNDDVIAQKTTSLGVKMNADAMVINCGINTNFGGKFSNDGTGNANAWTSDSGASVSYNSVTGVITVSSIPYTIPSYKMGIIPLVADPTAVQAFGVRSIFAGLGNGQAKFQLYELTTGNPITGAANADYMFECVGDNAYRSLDAATLGSENANIWTESSNIWLFAILQLD